MSKPVIKVTAFKESGKYYSSHETPLKDEHYSWCPAVKPYDMSEMMYDSLKTKNYRATELVKLGIKYNHPHVTDYSGLTCGFNGHYYYVIEILWKDDEYGSCLYHIDNMKRGTR